MATVTKNEKKQLRGPSFLLLAPYGTFPNEAVGYTDDAVSLKVDATYEEDEAQECVDAISSVMTKRKVTVGGTLAQVEADTVQKLLGVSPDGGNFGLSGEPEENEWALLVVNTRDDMSPVYLYLPRVKSDGSLDLALKRGKAVRPKYSFSSLRAAGAYFRFASAVADVTAATGSVTRSQPAPTQYITHLRVAGEGAAADDLTDITASLTGGSVAAVDGEILRIQIKSAAMPITIKHNASKIVLSDAADFVMTKPADWLDLRRSGTTWVEVARHDTE